MTGPPAAVAGRLALAGIVGRISRRPRLAFCAHCRAAIFMALEYDGIATGALVIADATPVTPAGELAAISTGLASFDHWGDAITYRLIEFARFIKTDHCRGVLVGHRCGARWPADPTAVRRLFPAIGRPAPDAPPPF